MKKIKNKDYSVIAKKISSELEYCIHNSAFNCSCIAEEIGMTGENFSIIRCRMRAGKIPPLKFLIGISIYFNKNFLVAPLI